MQLDCPDLALERHITYQDRPLGEFLGFVERVVAAINRALVNIPRERVRMHVCWGNYEGPHDQDVPLADILPIIRQAHVGGFVFPFANPRHAHEYRCFAGDVLDDDQILVAGVIDTLTNFVEHPEVVAERIERVAAAVGDPAPRARRHRLRLRHLRRHGPGRGGRGLGQAQGARRRRPARLGAPVLAGGISCPLAAGLRAGGPVPRSVLLLMGTHGSHGRRAEVGVRPRDALVIRCGRW